jgi:hypothetical protein
MDWSNQLKVKITADGKITVMVLGLLGFLIVE